MLYFAYGSNLHHFQMKRRCKDSIFLKKINLKDFRLTFRSKYRAADIEPKKNSIVPGALFEISKSDEKKLDVYEDFPILYKKHYFYYYGKKVMTYTMVKKSPFKFPTERYLNVVKRGYRDCKLNEKYLKKGSLIYIEGQLRNRKYTDQTGMEKNISEVVLQGYNTTLTMVDNRNNSDINELSSPSLDNSATDKNVTSDFDNVEVEDEVPF